MNKDKRADCLRYDTRAQRLQVAEGCGVEKNIFFGSLGVPAIYRAPYTYYEKCIRRFVTPNHDVLELGCGTGVHTFELLQTGARVVASDISRNSLEVLSRRFYKEGERIKTQVADMEALPFRDGMFDVVTSAGSLSYGDPELVNKEIGRVLRSGGIFICVDSLNDNPIYRLNRWVHYLRGDRTRSTILRMPSLKRIQDLSKMFRKSDVRYFGSVSFLMPFVARVFGENRAAVISDHVDRWARVRRSAFKFVLVALGRL